jgi:hypothetical protein
MSQVPAEVGPLLNPHQHLGDLDVRHQRGRPVDQCSGGIRHSRIQRLDLQSGGSDERVRQIVGHRHTVNCCELLFQQRH